MVVIQCCANFRCFPLYIFGLLFFYRIRYMPNICPPSSLPVNSKNGSIKLTRTRGSHMGQRCVGVCGRCLFATTSPTLSAAHFASKGSNIHGLMLKIQTSTTSSTSSGRGGLYEMIYLNSYYQCPVFVLPDFELSSPSR